MAQYRKAVLTAKGKELCSKAILGTSQIEFTKIETSAQKFTEAELETITSIGAVKQGCTAQVRKTNTSEVCISGLLQNRNITTGYYLRNFGIYCKDPDGTATDILYAVVSADESVEPPTMISAYNGIGSQGVNFSATVRVGDSEQVTINVDPTGMVTQAELTAVVENFTEEVAHANHPNLLPYPYYDNRRFYNDAYTTLGTVYEINRSTGEIAINANSWIKVTSVRLAQHLEFVLKPNTTYTLSGIPESLLTSKKAYLQLIDAGTILATDYGAGATFTTGDTFNCVILDIRVSGKITSPFLVSPMLEEGTVAHEYNPPTKSLTSVNTFTPKIEPLNTETYYGNGDIVSHIGRMYRTLTNEYATELRNSHNSFEELTFSDYARYLNGKYNTIQRGNLIPYPYYDYSKTENGVTFNIKDNGEVKVSGTATCNTYFYLYLDTEYSGRLAEIMGQDDNNLLSGIPYEVNNGKNTKSTANMWLEAGSFEEDIDNYTEVSTDFGTGSQCETLYADTHNFIRIVVRGGCTVDTCIKPQLELVIFRLDGGIFEPVPYMPTPQSNVSKIGIESIVPDWGKFSKPIDKGTYVSFNGKVWKCLSTSSYPPYVGSEWSAVTLASELEDTRRNLLYSRQFNCRAEFKGSETYQEHNIALSGYTPIMVTLEKYDSVGIGFKGAELKDSTTARIHYTYQGNSVTAYYYFRVLYVKN